jgi:hypothetical protein
MKKQASKKTQMRLSASLPSKALHGAADEGPSEQGRTTGGRNRKRTADIWAGSCRSALVEQCFEGCLMQISCALPGTTSAEHLG